MPRATTDAERQERRRQIVQFAASGHTQAEIADMIGVSRSLVGKELRAVTASPATSVHKRATAVAVAKQASASMATSAGAMAILPPPDHLGVWQRLDLDRDTWGKASPDQLISLLINVSPEASRATWDWLRLVNSGHEIIATKPGTVDQDERAQKVLDAFIDRLEANHGSFKAIAGRLFMGALTRGAFFAELVLDERGRVPLDLVTPDPATVRFKLVPVRDRGMVWMPGQWQNGKFVVFDVPTVSYMALDPEMDSPYGRPMLAPALFPTVFLIGVLHDLRRVIAQQGYPRTDVIVKLEKLRDAYSEMKDEEFEEMVDALIATVKSEMARLEPDDTFVHTDPVEVSRASGAVDASSMSGAAAIIEALERMATRALKSMPLLMGSSEGVAEANANRQWEIFAAGVGTVQHYAEALLGRLLTLALQAQGVVADVKVRFAEVRAAEELRDAQTFLAKLRGAELAERLGYYTADEAAEHATGHGIPEELQDTRTPLVGTATSSDADVTSATKVDGNESIRGTRAVQSTIDATRADAAVQAWRNQFADTPEASLLDATVEWGDA